MQDSVLWKPGFIPVYIASLVGLVVLFKLIDAPLLGMTPILVTLGGLALASMVYNARKPKPDPAG